MEAVVECELASTCRKAVELYSSGIPFAMVRVPGHAPILELNGEYNESDSIRIDAWKFDLPNEKYSISGLESTTYKDYITQISELVELLQINGGKTVIARRIVGNFPTTLCKNEVLSQRLTEYFDRFPDSLTFMFYKPDSGLWLGATPELLLFQERGQEARTQALAGSRPTGAIIEWSEKNIHEHQIVVKDMERRLNSHWDVECLPMGTVGYGPVEHLCTPMTIQSAYEDFSEVVEALHPTPAVCGFPTDTAISNISRFEKFPRQYYTGLISVETDSFKAAYVILRCANVREGRFCIYTGSGIVPDTVPEEEWRETQAKATPLVNLFS